MTSTDAVRAAGVGTRESAIDARTVARTAAALLGIATLAILGFAFARWGAGAGAAGVALVLGAATFVAIGSADSCGGAVRIGQPSSRLRESERAALVAWLQAELRNARFFHWRSVTAFEQAASKAAGRRVCLADVCELTERANVHIGIFGGGSVHLTRLVGLA